MADLPRTLTPAEQAIIRPLLERRATLLREVEALQMGIGGVVAAFIGQNDPSVSLDLETMTLRRQRTPEDAARELEEALGVTDVAGNGAPDPEVELSWQKGGA